MQAMARSVMTLEDFRWELSPVEGVLTATFDCDDPGNARRVNGSRLTQWRERTGDGGGGSASRHTDPLERDQCSAR